MSYQISTIAELEQHYAQPSEAALAKETPVINATYRQLIEAAPFVAIASSGPEGLDCSPRGDAPGFVQILDEKTLAIPDRRGNNRLDTLRNIVQEPRVALLFLIPGFNETLRINGRASISIDPDLLAGFEIFGKRPVTAIIVKIDTVYFQCARALKRSRLWEMDAQINPQSLPSAGNLIQSVLNDFDQEAYDAELPERQAQTLY